MQSIFYRNIYGSDLLKKYSMTPSWSPIWNYKALAIFLNEMQDFEPVSKKPTRNYKSENDSYSIFKFRHKKHGEKGNIKKDLMEQNIFFQVHFKRMSK